MDNQKVDLYIMTAANNLPAESLPIIKQKLQEADDNKFMTIQAIAMKSPMTAFWLDFFLGNLGADYFYLGKTGLGVVKLITCGGAGIWSLINLFTIFGTTKKSNYEKLMMYL